MTDEKILHMYWERLEDAITETSKKYWHYCFSIAYNILKDSEDASECVNDALFRVWQTIPPRYPNNLATYLGKITRNIALNKREYYQAQKRKNSQISLSFDELSHCISGKYNTESIVDSIYINEILNKFLENLDEVSRKIFVCRYWYLLSVKDISIKYNMTESAVKVSLFRSRAALKVILKKSDLI